MVTAEHVARALVAACRETNEDPVLVASREPGAFRSRHYAMFALLEVFPDLTGKEAARLVGCPGKPAVFFYNSLTKRATGRPGGGAWWNPAIFERVVAVLKSDGPLPPPEPPPYKPGPLPPVPVPPLPPAARLGTRDADGGYRPPPGTVETVLDDDNDGRPIFDRGRIGGERPRYPQPPSGKRDMYAELRQAVLNTKKMSPES